MHLDVERLRRDIPALRQGTAYFDGPGGTQVPRQVAHAVASAMGSGISNRGHVTESEQRAEAVVAEARAAMADLLGCDARGVVFARSMTQATYDVARTLAKDWSTGDEVVVTRLDHDANIRPWVQAAASTGATLRWAGFDPATGELTVEDLRAQLSTRTRLVAVTAASNVLGTRPDLSAIAEAVHDADFYACSPYKFLGPHLGVVAADPGLLETLRPDKLLTVCRHCAGALRARHAALRAAGRHDRCRRRAGRTGLLHAHSAGRLHA